MAILLIADLPLITSLTWPSVKELASMAKDEWMDLILLFLLNIGILSNDGYKESFSIF